MRIAANNQWKNDLNQEKWIAIGEDCSAEKRVEGLLRAYGEVMPDILALQEVSSHMTELMTPIMKELPFAEETAGRYAFISGGDTPIWYRVDRLTLIESGFSLFPEKIDDWPGRFNNGGTKSYAYGVFQDKESGKRIAVASVHLWWKSSDPNSRCYQPKSDEARARQLAMVTDKMEDVSHRYGIPAVILGDFNATMDSLALRDALSRGWMEAHDLSQEVPDETSGHHYCFPDGFRHDPPGSFNDAIDHVIVFQSEKLTVSRFGRHAPLYFDKLSDHFPLYVDIIY